MEHYCTFTTWVEQRQRVSLVAATDKIVELIVRASKSGIAERALMQQIAHDREVVRAIVQGLLDIGMVVAINWGRGRVFRMA